MRQRLAIHETRQRHDRILMRHHQRLMPPRRTQSRRQGRTHTRRNIPIRLTPRGTQRIAVVLVVLRIRQHRPIRIHRHTLKHVIGLNETRIRLNRQTIRRRRRRRRQLRAQQRRRNHARNIRTRIHQVLRGASSHRMAQLRQPKTRQTPVQNTVRIVHLTVAHNVNNGAFHNTQV